MIKENFFDEIIIQTWGQYATKDGITCAEEYAKAPIKILWVLKEANNGDEENPIPGNQRDFHKDITKQNREGKNYPWWNTYNNIIYASYGILHNNLIKNYNGIENINTKDATIYGEYVLSKIAFINIKKLSGGVKANNNVILSHYNDFKEIILNQIIGISPDVVINASRVDNLSKDLIERKICQKVITCGHPMAKSPWIYVDFILDEFNKSK